MFCTANNHVTFEKLFTFANVYTNPLSFLKSFPELTDGNHNRHMPVTFILFCSKLCFVFVIRETFQQALEERETNCKRVYFYLRREFLFENKLLFLTFYYYASILITCRAFCCYTRPLPLPMEYTFTLFTTCPTTPPPPHATDVCYCCHNLKHFIFVYSSRCFWNLQFRISKQEDWI